MSETYEELVEEAKQYIRDNYLSGKRTKGHKQRKFSEHDLEEEWVMKIYEAALLKFGADEYAALQAVRLDIKHNDQMQKFHEEELEKCKKARGSLQWKNHSIQAKCEHVVSEAINKLFDEINNETNKNKKRRTK